MKLFQNCVAMDIKSEVLKEIGGKIIEHRKRNKQTQEDISYRN